MIFVDQFIPHVLIPALLFYVPWFKRFSGIVLVQMITPTVRGPDCVVKWWGVRALVFRGNFLILIKLLLMNFKTFPPSTNLGGETFLPLRLQTLAPCSSISTSLKRLNTNSFPSEAELLLCFQLNITCSHYRSSSMLLAAITLKRDCRLKTGKNFSSF